MFKFFKKKEKQSVKEDSLMRILFRATSEASDDMLTAMSKYGLRSKEHNEAYQRFHTLYQTILRAGLRLEYDAFCDCRLANDALVVVGEVV